MSKKNKKDKVSSSLFNDKRVLLAFSFVVAITLWLWIAIEKSPEVEHVVSNVSVHIETENSVPKQLGLEVFGPTDFMIDVTVKGEKYIVKSLKPEDIEVIASTNYVDSPGIKTLQLKVSPKDDNADFEIVSYSTNYIEVYFDTKMTIEMPVEGIIKQDLSTVVPSDCITGNILLSKDTVSLSGPTSEINKITNVQAIVDIYYVLERTETFDCYLDLVTSDGSIPQYVTFNNGDSLITVTVPVLKEVVLPTKIQFKNAPSYFINNPLSYSIYPSKVNVAIPIDMIDSTEYYVVDTIDYCNISSSNNTFIIENKSINPSFKILDDNLKSFTVKVDTSRVVSKTFTVSSSNISINNNNDDYIVDLDNNKDIVVRIIGNESDIQKITSENLSIIVDTEGQEIQNDTTVLKGRVLINGNYPCWSYGYYDVNVIVS